jgi:hypothetical protein
MQSSAQIVQDTRARQEKPFELSLSKCFFRRQQWPGRPLPAFGIFHLGFDRLTFPTSRHAYIVAKSGYHGSVRRRHLLASLFFLPALSRAADPGQTLRGTLTKGGTLRTPDGKLVSLTGDADTMGVVNDARLQGADFEIHGKSEAPDRFAINPIHTRAMFVHKDGKRLTVTYWCDVCAIRTYTPGICWCCRDETALDLVDPGKVSSQ